MRDSALNRHPTFCSRPATDRDLTPDGMVLPCCELKTPKSYSSQDFQELHQALSSGIRHPHCRVCWEKEDLGQSSARLGFQSPQNVKQKVLRLNINLSNFCNLKCRMCNSVSSHLWERDEVELRKDSRFSKLLPPPVKGIQRPFASKDQLYAWLDEMDLEGLIQLKVGGGEPFLQKLFPDLLNYFIAKGLCQFRVLIHTNGTVIHPEVNALLEQFDETYFCLSIEAVGQMYQYIRGGEKFSISLIEDNLKKILHSTNFKLLQHSAIPAYGVFGIGKLIAWLIKNKCYQSESLSQKRDTFLPVFEPQYLGPQALPLKLREFAFEKSIQDLKTAGLNSNDHEDLLKHLLVLNQEADPEMTNDFILFTKKMDDLRGESLIKVEPAFAEVLGGFSTF